jgi:HPt (histidine-containing phosphotransfer) domain-containing protein
MTDAGSDDKTSALLAALWLRNRPLIEERLVQLDRAAAAAVTGALSEDMCEEASHTAHKLAGSLGMYGYDEGTRIAREIEALLGKDALDAAQLETLVAELRKTVFPEG